LKESYRTLQVCERRGKAYSGSETWQWGTAAENETRWYSHGTLQGYRQSSQTGTRWLVWHLVVVLTVSLGTLMVFNLQQKLDIGTYRYSGCHLENVIYQHESI